MIVDAHLDIAWNALARGHPFLAAPAEGYLVSRQSLLDAGVGLVFATVFCLPAARKGELRSAFAYRNAGEARLMASAQLNFYRSCGLNLITNGRALEEHVRDWAPGRLAAVALMEGADPIETPAQARLWAEAGIRVVGLAWGRTRYSGGTNAPGGLTEAGVRLLRTMRRSRMILDLSHMADRAVEDAFALWRGPVMASHSNSRVLCPGDRQLTDGTVREIARRGGVVGISFYRKHLRADDRPATIADVVAHATHLTQAAGGPEHVGIGSDADGGFPAVDTPIRRLDQLRVLRQRLERRFSRSQVDGILGGNWIDFLRRSLPDV